MMGVCVDKSVWDDGHFYKRKRICESVARAEAAVSCRVCVEGVMCGKGRI